MKLFSVILLICIYYIVSLNTKCLCEKKKICPCRHYHSFIQTNRIIFKTDSNDSNSTLHSNYTAAPK